jgi:DNA polymerase elongation subunit (family B)
MHLELFSDEIILIIFSFIDDFFDIKSLMLTSKNIKRLIEYHHLVYFFPVDVEELVFKNKYVLKIYGVLKNGEKALVNIHNYEPFFDILLENNNSIHEIYKIYKYKKFKIVKKYPLIGYNEEKLDFLRLYFENNQKRKQVINLMIENKFDTYSNDISFHYRKVTRENNISLASWNELRNYRYYKCKNTKLNIFDIEIGDIKLSKIQYEIKPLIILTWDIETSSIRPGELPKPEYEDNEVFMIGLTFHEKDSEEPIKKICVTTQECENGENWKLIICDDQKQLILTFAHIISKLKPDFIIGFNDSVYDWPFIIEKSKRLGIYKEFAEILTLRNFNSDEQIKFYERVMELKISSNEYIKSTFFRIPGTVCIDIRIALKKIFEKTEKSSLDFFLGMMDLGGKIDLPPNKLWKYYQDSKNNIVIDKFDSKQIHRKNIKKIAEYCINDALSCQLLNLKQNIIDSYIETAKISHISLFDTYAYGNSIRVKNYLGLSASDKDIIMDMIIKDNKNDVKYPGGFVFDPITGLNNRRPVSSLDIISLYPSIMMAMNFSPEKIIFKKDVHKFKDEDLFKIEFEFNGKKIEAWTIRHNNQQHKKGLYVIVLEKLFNERVKVKKQLNQEKNKFERIKLDLKQKALKVYMNSFYGETGNSISPLFLIELAGGVTSTGQNILKSISSKLINEKKCKMVYGDTDSTFFEIDDKNFEILDLQYNNNEITKQQYWTGMINKSFQESEKIKDEINKYLIQYTDTTYLKIAFDGIFFPSQFLGKKKYIGKLHKEILKFKDSKIEKMYWVNNNENYIRGVDVIKRGQSGFFKNMGYRIVNNILDIENEISNIQLIENIIEQSINEAKNIDIINFTKTALYKPTVKNISIQKFIKRMRDKNIQIPELGERFSYVVTERGKNMNIGDCMEFVEMFQNNGEMKLNMRYYFKSIKSICARFIVDELFDVDIIDRDKKSEKYIENIINKYYENNFNGNDIKKYFNMKEQKINKIRKNNLKCIKQTKIDLYFKSFK